MRSLENRLEQYRQRADELRDFADTMTSSHRKAVALCIAANYARMAEMMEKTQPMSRADGRSAS